LLITTIEEGDKLAKKLGDRRGVLIRNHGIVVGESVARTVYSSITVRDNAKILLSTISMGVEPRQALTINNINDIINTRFAKYNYSNKRNH
jgi:ribulose-5-phosphate 4-epimerase/fuculose-1-phosphate aldolase